MDKISSERRSNYARTLKFIEQNIEQPLTEEFIKIINAHVTGHINPSEYRNGDGATPIKSPITDKYQYLSPDSSMYSIKDLIAGLLEWYIGAPNPREQVARFHWGFVKIHPFSNGNGRTARLISIFILRKNGYSKEKCDQINDYFNSNINNYYDALDDNNLMYNDYKEVSDKWINYIMAGIPTPTTP